jgi:hypothetical protein
MIHPSRRTLLRASALGVVAMPFVSLESAAAGKAENLYARPRFASLAGAKFTLVGSTGSWPITLTQVGDLPGAGAGDPARFGLTFQAATSGPPQGTYTLRRPGFTSTILFVVPSDATRRTYQAIVNSLA